MKLLRACSDRAYLSTWLWGPGIGREPSMTRTPWFQCGWMGGNRAGLPLLHLASDCPYSSVVNPQKMGW